MISLGSMAMGQPQRSNRPMMVLRSTQLRCKTYGAPTSGIGQKQAAQAEIELAAPKARLRP